MSPIDIIEQIGIVLLGVPSIWMLGRTESWRRWGYIVGAVSQLFWFSIAMRHGQWGLFTLCFAYSYSWLQGIWYYFIKPSRMQSIDIDLPASTFLKLAQEAHERDITLNQMCNLLLSDHITRMHKDLDDVSK